MAGFWLVPLLYLSDLNIEMKESVALHTNVPQDFVVPTAAAAVLQGPLRRDPHGSRGVRVHP